MGENNKVFVDSNVFIGIFNADDALHDKAVKLWNNLAEKQYSIVVSNFILSEVITVLSQRIGKKEAIEFATRMYHNENNEVEIIWSNEQLELRALEYLRRIPSKNVSFADATILAVLETHQISSLATFDAILRKQKGFDVLP